MAVKLNRTGLDLALDRIAHGRLVLDDPDDWSEDEPSIEKENDFIRQHGFAEYGKWHLGIDDRKPPRTKGRYKFPFGDFIRVHRGALVAAEGRAGRHRHPEIYDAAARLRVLIDHNHRPGHLPDHG